MEGIKLTLYVSGGSARSEQARHGLRRLASELLCDGAELEIVDVLQDSPRARADGVLLTPTAVLAGSSGEVRVFGDLSDSGRVACGLGLGA